ncbi:gas vesicle protein K [Streptomyces turgidiscabies]|uniref:Gas vesicle protein K n=1 Tax=Streptomyces turgidiscabies (strain Car8) TaxID=698760 RepID=L7F3B1_STRT8|nr:MULTISPECIES: gas vesicle protein K [Streptomyces]ELP65604.1 gas vesicle protein K [Streptomyces turgidiscabies Car8]MDX3498196.1 gas vesicle protein K [Streptomyces turgidiscabies]GAQ75169.1 Gas vesicle protein K [Streptomyces turgidiscabies]
MTEGHRERHHHGPSPHPDPGLTDVGDSMSRAFRLVQAPPAGHDDVTSHAAHRMYTDRDTVEEDLLKLVLTLVELLRQLIERQALRRVDAGDLTDEQEEELGATLLALHDRLAELCAQHGYALEDLNLDLGPLGPLLPPGPDAR